MNCAFQNKKYTLLTNLFPLRAARFGHLDFQIAIQTAYLASAQQMCFSQNPKSETEYCLHKPTTFMDPARDIFHKPPDALTQRDFRSKELGLKSIVKSPINAWQSGLQQASVYLWNMLPTFVSLLLSIPVFHSNKLFPLTKAHAES